MFFPHPRCVTSTLSRSLFDIKEKIKPKGLDYLPNKKGENPLYPKDGAVFTPYVEIFREGSTKGYSFQTNNPPTMIDGVVSFAMPNFNPRVRDAPTESNLKEGNGKYTQEGKALVDAKW